LNSAADYRKSNKNNIAVKLFVIWKVYSLSLTFIQQSLGAQSHNNKIKSITLIKTS